MYSAFWWHALFVRGQSFSVKTFDRSCNCCQVIRLGLGNDFRGPFGQALPLPSHFFLSHARFFLCPLLPSACYAGNSQPVISASFCSLLSFVSSFSSFDLALLFIGLYQSCLDYGFVCWILNWLVCYLNNDVTSSIAGSADSACGFSRLL